jgi:trimethylamine:corrinoid methyltransferase-like protein
VESRASRPAWLGALYPRDDLASACLLTTFPFGVHYAIDGTSAFALDFETGAKRYGTRKDIESSLRIFQQLDMGVMAWSPTVVSEAPAHSRPLHEFVAIMKYCSKHGQHEFTVPPDSIR